MPTLGSHFNDEQADELQKIAATSEQKKIGPWIREAVRQRLEREGYLPGTEAHARKEKLRVLAESLSDAELDELVAKQFAGKAAATAA